jgi:hypothetical protein
MKPLVGLATAQLALGLVGLGHALRHRSSYDIGIMHGSPELIGREQWVTGTSLSAPGVMLVAQGAAVALLATREEQRAARTLGLLGLIMSLGYPGEKSVRRAWRHPDRFAAPLTAAATALSVAMAVLGLAPAVAHRFGNDLHDLAG